MRRRNGRRWARSICVVLVVAGLVATVWRMSVHETTLIDLARPILTPNTAGVSWRDIEESQGWLSSHEMLIASRHEARVFDTETHRSTRLQALTNLLNRPHRNQISYTVRVALSPDTAWLHWIDIRPGDERRYVHHVARLDGSAYREWSSDGPGEPLWIYDRRYLAPCRNIVKIPGRPELIACIASRHQTELLYFVRTDRFQPLTLLLHRLIPPVHAERRISEELWISKIDGTDMHALGHVQGGGSGLMLNHIHWLPDGKHISFVWRGSLYVLPAGASREIR